MHLRLHSPPHSSSSSSFAHSRKEAADLSPDPTPRDGDMASRVAALLLLGVICARFAQGEMVVDCCLSTTDKFFPLIKIETYTLQHAGQGCDLSATVFITKAARTVCIVHPSAENKRTKWVKSHIQYLDNKKRARK